jgi:diguanylate cyclase (GGDEF)-like protein/PAS domain S-box-containing protein
VTIDEELHRRADRTLRQQTALLELFAVGDEPFDERLCRILEVAAATIGVARASVWTFEQRPPAIRCDALYRTAEQKIERGLVLTAAEFPRYFRGLRTGKPIVAADAHRDPQTSEFSASYLTPEGIGAMLDVPVFIRGQLVGVVCHEHVGGPREWTADEQMFAMAIGGTVSLATEIRRRQSVEDELRRGEERFRSIVEAAPIPMLVTSVADGTCLYGNRATSRLSGVPYDLLVGHKTPDFYADPTDRSEMIRELAEHGRVDGREVRLRRADGSTYWALVSVHPLQFGEQPALISGFFDLTSQKAMEEQLRHMALHDPLTGLPNRVYFFGLLRKELARARRDPSYQFAVLFIDLDGFKLVNDSEGHDVGDAVLAAVAERIQGSLRESDTAARMGGDEFTALLIGLKDATEASWIADRISAALCEPIEVAGRTLSIRGSIGVAMGSASTAEAGDLVREADAAMYRAKQALRSAGASR